MLYNFALNPTASTQTLDLAPGDVPLGVDAPVDHPGSNLVQAQGGAVRVTFEGVASGPGLLLGDGEVIQMNVDGLNQALFAADAVACRVYVMHHN